VKNRAAELGAREVEALRQELAQRVGRHCSRALECKPGGRAALRSQARLTLMDLLRKLFGEQTRRRMNEQSLSAEETEAIGLALMRLEETITDLGRRFGLFVDELNLDLGPLGRRR
jgi:hypothetical protein